MALLRWLSSTWRYLATSGSPEEHTISSGIRVYLATGGARERIGEDNPEEEEIFRDPWEDETQREVVIDGLKADSVRSGRGGLRGFEGWVHGEFRGGCLCGGVRENPQKAGANLNFVEYIYFCEAG